KKCVALPPPGLFSTRAFPLPSLPHRRPPSSRPYRHPKRHQPRNVRLVLQRGLFEESPAPGTAAARPAPQTVEEARSECRGDGFAAIPLRSDQTADRRVDQEGREGEGDYSRRSVL